MASPDAETSQSALYPLFLDLRGVPVLLVGAGSVARRKGESLLRAGAHLHLVAPDAARLRDHFRRLGLPSAREGDVAELVIEERAFEPADLDGIQLAFAATSSFATNAMVASLSRARGIFVNVADSLELSSAVTPAAFREGDHLAVAVTTRGASPRLAKLLRDHLRGSVGPEWARCAQLLATLRGWWEPLARTAGISQPQRQAVWESLVRRDLVERLRGESDSGIEDELKARLRDALEKDD